MPRQNRRRREDVAEPDPEALGRGVVRHEEASDGEWNVRTITGAAANKTYRCPGCDQEIRPGTPHVVAWPEHGTGLDERRHWHTSCWSARLRRRRSPTRPR